MTKLKYTVDVVDGSNYVVINLPIGLTINNRRLHRSCLEYTVNGGYVYDSNNSVRCKFGVAPDNWAIRASIKRARNHWLKMHRELFSNNPALKPKWHDFKMYLSEWQIIPEQEKSVVTYNVPEDIYDDDLPFEEKGITWSNFVTEDGMAASGTNNTNKDEFTAHLLGDHINDSSGGGYKSIGVLKSWYRSRPDLDPPSETMSDAESVIVQNDPLNLLFNDGDADNEIIENFDNAVEGDGDQEGDRYPSYHLTYPPQTVVEAAACSTTSSNTVSYFTGFKALLGQVMVKIVSNGDGKVDLMFDVDPRGATI